MRLLRHQDCFNSGNTNLFKPKILKIFKEQNKYIIITYNLY